MKKSLFFVCLFGIQTLIAQNFNGGPGSGYTENGSGMVAMPADLNLTESFAGVHHGSADWGDYDLDGRLDLLLTGFSSTENLNPVTKIFRNTTSGFAEVFEGVLPAVGKSCAKWVDFDNDGDLDIAIAGFNGANPVTGLFENTTGGFVEKYAGTFPGLTEANLLWADLNNDGLKDLVMCGKTDDNLKHTKVFSNNGNGFTENTDANLTGVIYGNIAASDFDLDGDLDLILTGLSDLGASTKLYLNQQLGFEEAFIGQFDNISDGALSVGDFDSDGKPDIFISGLYESVSVAQLYKNTGSGFTEVFAGSFAGLINGSNAWGDYDNDGDLDILVSGEIAPENFVTMLYENVDTNFVEIPNIGLANVAFSAVSWVDYDNDNDLDVFTCGSDAIGNPVSNLYSNMGGVLNTSPNPPSNLSANLNGSQIVFTWDKGNDSQTPADGLSYDLYVYDNVHEKYLVYPHSKLSNGNRLISNVGSILWRSGGYALNITTQSNFSWGVQAIDAAFKASVFVAGPELIHNCEASYTALVEGLNVNFSNTSQGLASNYLWAFGDGYYSTLSNPDHEYSEPGYYNICLTMYDAQSGCMSEYCSTIAVLDTATDLCNSSFTYQFQNDTVVFNNTSSGVYTNVLWDFGNGVYSVAPNPSHVFTMAGFYNVCLTVFNSGTGCLHTSCQSIEISDSLIASCKADYISFVEGNSVYFTSISTGTDLEHFWDFGDGKYAFTSDANHTFARPASYNVSLTVFDTQSGCMDKITKSITVVDSTAYFCNSNFNYYSQNREVYFNSSSTGNITSYFWNFGDGSYAFSENTSHLYSEPGYYEVVLTVYNDTTGCMDDFSVSVLVIDTNIVVCNARFSYFPQPEGIQFQNQAVGNYSKVFWDFGDGFNTNQTNPLHAFLNAGYYTVCLSVIDSANGCFDSYCQTIFAEGETPQEVVQANFSYIPTDTSLNVVFADLSYGNPDMWYWNFGDNTPAQEIQNPSHIYADSGFYRVCLTVGNSISQNTKCKSIGVGNVSNSAMAYFSYFADSVTATAYFKNLSLGSGLTYLWNFGDGNTSSQKNPAHTYQDTGYYAVCLTVSNTAGISSEYCQDVRIGNALANPCLFSCVWPGDANNDLEANHYDIMTIGLNYNMTGPSRENASIAWFGQFAQNWSTFQFNGVNNKHGDCNGDGIINMDDTLAIDQNFAYSHYFTPDVSKDFDWEINCEWLPEGLKASSRKAAAKLSPPQGKEDGQIYALGYEIEVINGQGIIFSGIKVNFGNSWIGTPGENMLTVVKLDSINQQILIGMTRIDHQNITGLGAIAEITFPLLEGYDGSNVSFRVYTLGGIENTGSPLVVAQGFTIDMEDELNLCQGDSALISAPYGFQDYLWSNQMSDTSQIWVSEPGWYFVTVTNDGIVRVDSVLVNEFESPVLTMEDSYSFCMGDNLILDAGAGFDSYLWSTGDTTQTIVASAADTVTVTVFNEFNCSDYSEVVVIENPLPSLDLGDDADICFGDTHTLDAGAGFVSYHWNTGQTGSSINVAQSGNYSVEVEDTNACSNIDSVLVTVHDLPMVDLGADFSQPDSALLDAGAGFSSYLWSNNLTTQTIYVFETGEYWVEVSDGFECVGYDTVFVTITNIPNYKAIEKVHIYPNPSKGSFSFELESRFTENVLIELFNSHGQLVLTREYLKVASVFDQLEYEGGRGVFNLRVIKGNTAKNFKVVIE